MSVNKLANGIWQWPFMLTLLMLALTANVQAKSANLGNKDTFQQRVNRGELQARLLLVQPDFPVVGQKLVFRLEVSSTSPFEKDFELVLPPLKDAIVLPAGLAGSQRRIVDGENRYLQQLELVLYPLRQGTFRLAPIALEVFLDADAGTGTRAINGQLSTPAHAFDVGVPAAMQSDERFWVTPAFELDHQLNTKDELLVGDSITETIVFTAEGIPAMMLPDVDGNLRIGGQVNHIGVYQKLPILSDDYDPAKAVKVGRRQETITYVAEKAGKLVLPERRFAWWNPNTGQRHETVIPQKQWLVTDGQAPGSNPAKAITELLSSAKVTWLGLTLLLLAGILMAARLAHHHRETLAKGFHQLNRTRYKKLKASYLQSIANRDYLSACRCLAQLVPDGGITTLRRALSGQARAHQLLENLYARAYGFETDPLPISNQDARHLLSAVTGIGRQSTRSLSQRARNTFYLELN